MRKSVLVGLFGVAMLIVGLVAAVWIGPDDWVDSPAQVLNGGGEVAVVTNYGLLSQAFPMRVSATSEGGEVFVGIAHVIDSDDYLAETTTSQIGWFGPTGLRAERRTAASSALPAAPATLDWWRSSASGPGTQSVEGSFRGQPVVAVITTPSGASTTLRVWMGSRFVGAFAAALALAGLGLALLLASIWWRRQHRGGHPGVDGAGTDEQLTVGGLTALTLAVALGVSGCTTLPSIGSLDLPPRAEVTRDALDGLDLAALAADYNRRNDAAIAAAAAPKYSAQKWAEADAELVLGADRFDTAWEKATKEKHKVGQPCSVRLGAAYPTQPASGYPMSIVVSFGWTCGAGSNDPPKNYAVFIRPHAHLPWLHAALVGGASPILPPPGSAPPGPEARASFAQATATITTQLAEGSTGLALPPDLTDWRTDSLEPTAWCTNEWEVVGLPDGIRPFQTETGTFAIASLLVTEHFKAKPGQTVGWDPPERAVYPMSSSSTDAYRVSGLTVVLQLTPAGVEIVSWYAPDYRQA